MTPTTPASLADCEQRMTRSEAVAAGLYVAEWFLGDEVVRGYGRTEAEAVRRATARRDLLSRLYTFGPSQ